MAARSFTITIDNLTGLAWDRIGLGLEHGEWSNNGASVPPEHIPAAQFDVFGHLTDTPLTFGNESDGFATGAQGYVDYKNVLGQTFHIDWDNPYIGSNSFNTNSSAFQTPIVGDIGGNNANLTVQIK
ncbi:MAG: aegerolysin family protein [Nostoc sp.]|uniref:aegerolysin family protein n=1 Tax=Nostoc sp. TaxID=1180 RepID=UPI002FF8D2EB